jgi:CHAD domain-containing protein
MNKPRDSIPARPPAIGLSTAAIGSSLAALLEARHESCRRKLKAARREFGAEAVHDLRVHTRRLLAAMELAAGLVDPELAAEASAVLKSRLRSFRDLRDLQVQRQFVARCFGRYPELDALLHHLDRRRATLVRNLRRRPPKPKHRAAVEQAVASVVAKLRGAARRPGRGRRRATRLAAMVDRAYAQAVSRDAAIERDRPETVHRARVAFKRFRYAMESLPEELRASTPLWRRRMRGHQDRMGAIQDTDQLRRRVAKLIRKGRLRADLTRFLHFLERRQERLTAGFLASGRLRNSARVLWYRRSRR